MIEVTGFLAMQKSVIGFALAFGVLVDAFLVRMTFVPAVLALLDRRAWWPTPWMYRLMQNFDVEGEKLLNVLELPGPAEAEHRPAPVADR